MKPYRVAEVEFFTGWSPVWASGCKNRHAPFPGWMLYKVPKPGLVLFYILACFNCIVAH